MPPDKQRTHADSFNRSNLTTVIMAGGKSSRMGTDKSFIPVLGKPMIEHVLECVGDLGSETIIITNNPEEYGYLHLPLYGDIYRDLGPLGGLHAALTYAVYPSVLVVACDMPWLNRRLLEYMVSLRAEADVIVPLWNRFPEPLHALYNKVCLEAIEANLEAGRLKLISFYGKVHVRYLPGEEIRLFDPLGRSFANVNTPDDLSDIGNKG